MARLPEPVSIPLARIETGAFNFSPPASPNKKIAEMRLLPREDSLGLLEWTKKYRPFLGPNRPFRLDNHPYLVGIYDCKSHEIVLQKAAQMGASEWLISYATHVCDVRNGNCLYVLATEGSVSDFSTARLGPAIEASPYLSKIVIDGSGSAGMRGSDRITLKRIRDRFLYFRGSKVQTNGNAPQLRSIDADCLLLDEVDELDPRAPAMARKRLGHAKEDINTVVWVSTPTYPNVGIHEQYLLSDQRLWHIKCEHCGEWQPLEINMCVTEWDSLGRPYDWHGKLDNTAWLACRKCGGELNRLAVGAWVPTYPERETAGFHLSKLFSAQMRLLDVVYNADTVDDTKKKEFYNQDLGLPYLPRGGHLEADQIDNCRRDYGHGPDYHATCYMGVDIGKVNHVVIRTLADFPSGETRQLYAGATDFEGVERLIKIYRPRIVVIDAQPEVHKVRELQEKYPYNMVWVSYYTNQSQGNKREQFCVFDAKERKVTIDRTRSLDDTYAGFRAGTSTLPRHARGIADYYDHLRNSIRVIETDNSGTDVAKYKDIGPDHYAHSENLCNVASKCRLGFGWVEAAGE